MPGPGATYRLSRSSASSSTAPSCGCGSTARRPQSRCLSCLACARTGRRCSSRKNMGGESEAAWRAILDDRVARGLRTPEFVLVDGAPGLEKALAVLWPEVPTQRCTVHKHRNLLAHAPDRLHEEVSADYTDMIYAANATEVAERRKAFLRK